jgi:hypothetical protein
MGNQQRASFSGCAPSLLQWLPPATAALPQLAPAACNTRRFPSYISATAPLQNGCVPCCATSGAASWLPRACLRPGCAPHPLGQRFMPSCDGALVNEVLPTGRQGVLLHGPPGVGRTALALAIGRAFEKDPDSLVRGSSRQKLALDFSGLLSGRTLKSAVLGRTQAFVAAVSCGELAGEQPSVIRAALESAFLQVRDFPAPRAGATSFAMDAVAEVPLSLDVCCRAGPLSSARAGDTG